MNDTKNALDALRDEIDAIDDALHDALMRRTTLVERVGALKRGQGVQREQSVMIRPAREANIMYRLAGRHAGAFPMPELARIWRELIVATLPLEGPFSAAVHVPEGEYGCWDLARDHYGSVTAMTAFGAARRVVEAARTLEATVGVVPVPARDDAEPWWPHLVSEAQDVPRIVARLPFAGRGNGRGTTEALVISRAPVEATGRDRSYLVVEAVEEIGLAGLDRALATADYNPHFTAAWHDADSPDRWLYLAEVEGFTATGDRQITRLAEAAGEHARHVFVLGTYARALDAAQPAAPEKAETKDAGP